MPLHVQDEDKHDSSRSKLSNFYSDMVPPPPPIDPVSFTEAEVATAQNSLRFTELLYSGSEKLIVTVPQQPPRKLFVQLDKVTRVVLPAFMRVKAV